MHLSEIISIEVKVIVVNNVEITYFSLKNNYWRQKMLSNKIFFLMYFDIVSKFEL